MAPGPHATLVPLEVGLTGAELPKSSRRWIVTAVVTALGSGAGTVAKAILDHAEAGRLAELEAEARARAAELEATRWTEAAAALEAVDRELAARAARLAELETRLARAEVAIDFLTADQRWIRRVAEDRADPAEPASREAIRLPAYGELEPDPDRVQQRKVKILKSLE